MKPWRRLLILELVHDGHALPGFCTYADVRRHLADLVEQTDTPGIYTLTSAGQQEMARLRAALAIAEEVETICRES